MRPTDDQRETAKMVLRDLLRNETLYQRDQIALTIALAALEPASDEEIMRVYDCTSGDNRILKTIRHFLGPVKT